MRTTIDLRDELLEELMRLHQGETKSGAVNAAIERYVRQKKLERLSELFGQIDVHPDTAKWRNTVDLPSEIERLEGSKKKAE